MVMTGGLVVIAALTATASAAERPLLTRNSLTGSASKALILRGGGSAPSPRQAAPLATAVAANAALLAGYATYAQSPFGMGAAIVLAASAAASASGNFGAYMAGVHVALLLQAGSVGAFSFNAARLALQSGASQRLAVNMAMSSGSVAALGAMMRFKPKKKK
jgi:hypothetical protein